MLRRLVESTGIPNTPLAFSSKEAAMALIRASKVFVAGGQPTITYVSRAALSLENKLKSAISDGYSLITVTGATKSGKTVLCKNIISKDESIWISGGEIKTEEEFWDRIVDDLEIAQTQTETASRQTGDTTKGGVKLGANFGIINAGVEFGGDAQSSAVSAKSRTRTRSSKVTALKSLSEFQGTIVIDDFHYIENEIQKSLIRALKQKIFDGLRVVVLAIPHRAYDVVKVETEMTGRVRQIEIPKWSSEELSEIPGVGFDRLNADVPDSIRSTLISESFASPHLMQWFCSRICADNGIESTLPEKKVISIEDERSFFSDIAVNTSKRAFDRLAAGPRQRTDRIARSFSDGTQGDIYLAILRAISATGPKLALTYEEVRSKLRELMSGEIPQSHEVGRVLVKMTEIARDKIEGEAVIEWDDDEKILHIIDPFFAFYLRWGTHSSTGK